MTIGTIGPPYPRPKCRPLPRPGEPPPGPPGETLYDRKRREREFMERTTAAEKVSLSRNKDNYDIAVEMLDMIATNPGGVMIPLLPEPPPIETRDI